MFFVAIWKMLSNPIQQHPAAFLKRRHNAAFDVNYSPKKIRDPRRNVKPIGMPIDKVLFLSHPKNQIAVEE
jgi:hypothetical protein